MKEFFEDTLIVFKGVLETWEGCESFLPKLDYLMKHLGDIGQKSYTPNKPGNGYNVLNHGDFHSRNILLKHNAASQIEKFLFVSYLIFSTFIFLLNSGNNF